MAGSVKTTAPPKFPCCAREALLRQQHAQTSMSGKSAVCKFRHSSAKGGSWKNQPFVTSAVNDGGEPELTMLRVDQMAVVRLAAD